MQVCSLQPALVYTSHMQVCSLQSALVARCAHPTCRFAACVCACMHTCASVHIPHAGMQPACVCLHAYMCKCTHPTCRYAACVCVPACIHVQVWACIARSREGRQLRWCGYPLLYVLGYNCERLDVDEQATNHICRARHTVLAGARTIRRACAGQLDMSRRNVRVCVACAHPHIRMSTICCTTVHVLSRKVAVLDGHSCSKSSPFAPHVCRDLHELCLRSATLTHAPLLQLGGPRVMGVNGVSHHLAADDLDGVRTMLRLLAYCPPDLGGVAGRWPGGDCI